jgi:hypothetical protein
VLTALRKSRENAWTVIKQRKHDIISVYAHDKEGLDLVIHGEAMNVVNGTELKGQFLAKLQLAPNPAADGAHKIFSYEVYAVSKQFRHFGVNTVNLTIFCK